MSEERRTGEEYRTARRSWIVGTSIRSVALMALVAVVPGGAAIGSVGARAGASPPTVSKVAGGSSACSVPSGPAPPLQRGLPTGPVSQAGRWLVDAEGRVLLLHGVAEVAKQAPFYPCAFGFDDADASFLAHSGMEVVRLGVMASGEMPSMGKIDQHYINKLADTVDDLARHHIFTLLDWHQDDYGLYFNDPGTPYLADGFARWMTVTNGAPNRQTLFPLDYTFDPALQEAFQAFWDNERVPGGARLQHYDTTMMRAVAKRFAKDPWVLGYELMNEPWPGTEWTPCLSGTGCPQEQAKELTTFYTRAVAAIRSVDPHHVIFMEPFVLFNFGLVPVGLRLPTGVDNVGLAFHEYASPAHQKALFANVLRWSHRHTGALLNTEWSSGGSASSITAQAGEEDAALMPWTYWVFDNCTVACASAKAANFLLNPKQPPRGSNVNAGVVDNVVRPYPIAVAGTPESLGVNMTGHVLRFRWTTRRAKGRGRFGAGALSAFAVPRRDYPNGYTAAVRGGTVVSRPCASTLVVRQHAVRSLSLLIRPPTPGAACGGP